MLQICIMYIWYFFSKQCLCPLCKGPPQPITSSTWHTYFLIWYCTSPSLPLLFPVFKIFYCPLHFMPYHVVFFFPSIIPSFGSQPIHTINYESVRPHTRLSPRYTHILSSWDSFQCRPYQNPHPLSRTRPMCSTSVRTDFRPSRPLPSSYLPQWYHAMLRGILCRYPTILKLFLHDHKSVCAA